MENIQKILSIKELELSIDKQVTKILTKKQCYFEVRKNTL